MSIVPAWRRQGAALACSTAAALTVLLASPPATSAPTSATPPPAPRAAPVYTITWLPEDLGAVAMNRAGRVATSGRDYVAVWSESGVRRLPTPNGGYADALAINGRDDITLNTSDQHAYAYIGGALVDIGAAAPGYAYSYARGINDAGWVVGAVNGRPDTSQSWAFIYRNGNVQVLPRFAGGTQGLAMAVNNGGQVTGRAGLRLANGSETERAFLYDNGRLTDLGTLGGDRSFGLDISDRGDVAGVSWRADLPGARGFLYAGGKMVDIGSLGGNETNAFAVNDAGGVVGHSYPAGASQARAVMWVRGHLVDLNRLLAPPAGWTADYALDINDAWQVLVVLCHDVAGVRSCRTGRLEPPPGTGDYKIPPFIRSLGEGRLP